MRNDDNRPAAEVDGALAPPAEGDGAREAPGGDRPRLARWRRPAAGGPADETDVRIAAIDIGSNSIRQIVADVSPSGAIRIVDEMKAMPRLGKGVDASGALSEESMTAALGALERMSELARRLGADRVEAVATSAVR